jgi:predicted phosphodiesterase
MKYALVTDIHGNLEALQAVLAHIDAHWPGATLLCAGDVVGYGPDPGACVDLLMSRQVPCVRGNHEEMVLGLRDFSRCVSAGISAARWTRRQLTPEQSRFLRDLPIQRPITDELVLCHGDMESADTYVSDTPSAQLALAQMARALPSARLLVCGHTHHAAIYDSIEGFLPQPEPRTLALDPTRRYVINAGAAGQSRDGSALARYAVLDLGAGTVSFHALSYDHATTERKMRLAGLQGGVILAAPTGLRRRVERMRTRWQQYRGEAENRRLGLVPTYKA